MSESSLANDAAQSVSESMTTTTATVLATAAPSSAAVFSSTIKPNTISNGKDYSSTLSAITETIKSLISSTTTTTAATTTSSVTTSMPFTTSPIKTTTGSSTFTSTMSAGGFMNAYSSFGSSSGPMDSGPVEATEPALQTNRLSVSDLSSSLQHFGFVDYFVFVMMLAVCAVIGFYFGFIEKKKKKKRDIEERRGSEALDYLVGGRKMKVFPVSLSLVASFVSGISLLGTSTEIYVYGTQYAFILITLVISGVISWYVFLPVFCNLQLTSTYEYLERRFDRRLRLFGSMLFILIAVMWMPISIYVPALTFNQVTGVDIHYITPAVCVVCTIYTCVGGIKGVMWTDVLQSFIMIGSLILVIIKGTIDVGGLGVVYQRNYDSGRIEAPEWTFDPSVRMGFFALFVGGTLFKLTVAGIGQVAVQRYLSLPSMKEVKQCVIIFTIGFSFLLSLCIYLGMLTYAAHYDCDPITTKLAKAKDQVVPLYVIEVVGKLPGVVGIFVSAVFSAALSSLSTVLNSLSGVILKDFIEPYRSEPLTEKQTAIVLRLVVLIFGIAAIFMVPIVEHLGLVMQLSTSVNSIVSGPSLGVFIVGMLMPFVKTKSCLTGCSVAFLTVAYVAFRAQWSFAKGQLRYATKPVSIEGCDYDFELPANYNATVDESLFPSMSKGIHNLSFLWVGALGTVVTIVVSLLATLYFGSQDTSEVDPELIVPFLRRYMKPRKYKSVPDVAVTEMKELDTKNESDLKK